MSYRFETYCGLYCGACPVSLANQAGDLAPLAAAWGRSVAELQCGGCKSGERAVFCADCEFVTCAEARGVEFCFECDDYPCPRLVAFSRDEHPHHHIVLHNLEALAAQGLEAWLAAQAERWRCPACGQAFGWYSNVCEGCDASLYDARAEDQDLRAETPA